MKKRCFGEEKRRSVGAWARRGSPTMEYIILIAVGALFAGLLYLAMSDGEGLIQSAMEKRVQEIIQGQLPEGKPSENNPENRGSSDIGNAPEIGDPRDIGANPEIGASPDAGIPPELEGPSDRSGTTSAGVNPEADGTSPSTTGGTSGGATAEGKSSASQEEGKGGLSGWWDKTKNYVASGQILKDAAHLGKETLDFLILDDVSGCITGKDTDGNELAGWERGLSCVSLVPAAKVAKVGKYADEALAFAGKLDDKLAKTRLGEGLQTAKRKLEDLFGRGKQVACGCDDNVGKNVKAPHKSLYSKKGKNGEIVWCEKGSSKKLARNLRKAGKYPQREGQAAHHIVAHGHPDLNAEATRKVYWKHMGYGNIDNAINGVWLDHNKKVGPGNYHRTLHTETYFREVYNRIKHVKNEDELREALEQIRKELENGTFPY